jgi:hypothetical protein
VLSNFPFGVQRLFHVLLASPGQLSAYRCSLLDLAQLAPMMQTQGQAAEMQYCQTRGLSRKERCLNNGMGVELNAPIRHRYPYKAPCFAKER